MALSNPKGYVGILAFICFLFITSFASAQILSSITDPRDDQQYRTVLIGNHWWMAQNLNIGTWIDLIGDQTDNGSIQKFCYNNLGWYCDTFGGLYQWNEIMNYNPDNKQGICPDGWHVPSENDWKELEFAAGMPEIDLDKTGWLRGTNEGTFLKEGGGSGFEAQLGGGISDDKQSLWVNEFGFLWASDQYNDQQAWIHVFRADTSTIRFGSAFKQDALSVRCVCDNNEFLTLSIEAEETVCAGQEISLKAKVKGGTENKDYRWTSDPPGFFSTDSIIFVRPETETIYRVRVIDGNIYTVDSVKVIVQPVPAFIINGENKVCLTEENLENLEYIAVTLNPEDYSYIWSPSDGSIITASQNAVLVDWGTTPGARTLGVQVTDKNTECFNRINYEVEILPAPPKPIIMSKGEHLLICSDSGRIYQWYQNDAAIPGANKQFYYAKGNKTGSFRIETKLDNQCMNWSDPYSFLIKSTGGSGDESQTVFIRPNPASGCIMMDIINDFTGQVDVMVTNSIGTIIRHIVLHKQSQVFEAGIDLGGMAEGFYLVLVTYGNHKEVHRLTIRK